MAKEWILNSAINRCGLQGKKMVGAVSDEIRKCVTRAVKERKEYYFEHFHCKEHLSKEHLIER